MRLTPILLLGLLLAGSAGHAATGADWLPLEVGSRWTYSTSSDHNYTPPAGEQLRDFQRSEREELVSGEGPGPGGLGSIYRVQVRAGGRARPDRYLAADENGVAMYAIPDGFVAGWPRFESPPVRLVPASPKPGQTWNAGTLVEGDVRIKLRGEVLGFEEVEAGGITRYGCLHVRLTGTPYGSTVQSFGRAEVRGGRFRLDLWLERDVGIVKHLGVTEFRLELENGQKAITSSIVTRRLEDATKGD